MPRSLSRRSFIKSAGVAWAGYWATTNSPAGTSAIARAASPNEKLNIAVVGLGRQGSDDISDMLHENIVAIADVDHGYMMKKAGKMVEKFPNVKLFEDFRVMFDRMENQIDAVVVATPDHVHFHPAWSAMQRGKHLYQEKPLAHNVWEVRQLTNLARDKKLSTQWACNVTFTRDFAMESNLFAREWWAMSKKCTPGWEVRAAVEIGRR